MSSAEAQQPTDVPRPWSKSPWLFAALVMAVALPVLRPCTRNIPEPPPIIAEVDAVDLVDAGGRIFDLERLKGRVHLISCFAADAPAEPLVVGMQRIAEGLERSAHLDRVALLTVSLDPERDGPAALRDLAEELGADPARWTFVTGTPAGVRDFVNEELGLGVALGSAQWSPRLALVDSGGRLRGRYDVTATDGLQEAFFRGESVDREERRKRRVGSDR
jgi:protein SCO1/2